MPTVIVKEPQMAGEVRGRMVEGAALLLAKQGLQATSFSEVLKATGAPRGSIYHHFPEGKDQLVDAALELVAGRMLAGLAELDGRGAVEITRYVIGAWRFVLDRSRLRAGCAVLAVAVAGDSGPLLDRAAAIFRAWRARLTELYAAAGAEPAAAARFATSVIAATEGAVVLCRAERSLEPLELVGEELLERAARL
ncbi:TetR/AcrR family transcriptional regulator [Dactylosporangium sp. NPDC051485]|uniref:TetR/AcrR family transcriptional regulator n=1 Tax=Dactylosporangium sp. NPDC051485 TaxID=3154846 RepID=UPI003424F703